jgi:hypothetical protein
MSGLIPISETAFKILKRGGVFVPSPLALDDKYLPSESYQRLLTLYYIRSGAKAVIPGAHTGEFALHDVQVFSNWLNLVKEMSREYGEDMILMTAIGGNGSLRQAEMAAKIGYDIVMVAPTAFAGKDLNGVIELLRDIASIIPTFGFELQRAIPGSYTFTHELWKKIFDITYGAKGASFDTYRSINMLQAAACSARKEQLVMLTGNDDRIVTDLLGEFTFNDGHGQQSIRYSGGLLGHFATDTNAVVRWVDEIMQFRETGNWKLPMSWTELAHAVNYCNMVLFDALGNFENSVWGVKYRLASMGLLPGPYCAHEKGRKGQGAAIDKVYGNYPLLTDTKFLRENLDWMRKEVGIKK